jgi:hypothetical protein
LDSKKDNEVQLISKKQFETQFKSRFGTVAGYIPKDLEQIGTWLNDQVKVATSKKANEGDDLSLLPSVNALATILKNDKNLNDEVSAMIQEGLSIYTKYEPTAKYYVATLQTLLITLNFMILQAPKFMPKTPHSSFPMSGLFVYMMATPSG